MRFRISHAMMAVVVVGVLLVALRGVVSYHPHVRRCWELAERDEWISQAYLRAASDYRACVKAVPCSPSEYCGNACLGHLARHPAASDEDRTRVAEAHRRAAEDSQRVAELYAAMARLYRRAAFRWSEPLPDRTAVEQERAAMMDRYRCDMM